MTYKKYQNFYDMLVGKQYRNYDTISPKLSNQEYDEAIKRGMIFIYCAYPKDFRRPELQSVPIVGIFCDAKLQLIVATYTLMMNEIDNKINENSNKVLIIASATPLTTTIAAKLADRADIIWYRYSLNNFVIRPDQTIHMAKHSVEDPSEIKVLEEMQYVNTKNLPEIEADDAGIIWINAFPGDVIRIEGASQLTMSTITYRVVKKYRKRKAIK